MMTFSRKQHIFWQIIVYAFILLNINIFHSPIIGIILATLYLWLNSKKLADIYFPYIKKGLKNLLGFLALLTYISLNYTVAYHFYQINFWVFLWVFSSIPIIIEILSRQNFTQHYFLKDINWSVFHIKKIRYLLPILLFLAIDIVLFYVLFKKSSGGIIRSPWEILNYKFWTLFVINNILLAITSINKKYPKNVLLYSLHFFLITSIGIIIYKNGFGYDSFIHQATLKTIIDTGTIEPKLFLYMGQYGITLFLSTLSQISYVTIDKILLPLLFSLFWPCSILCGLRFGFKWSDSASYLAILWSSFVGLSFATMTTPQNTVFLLFGISIFLLGEFGSKNIKLYVIWLIVLLSMTIHPLGAMPLFFIALLLSSRKIKKIKKFRNSLSNFIIITASISLPLLFILYDLQKQKPFSEIFSFNIWPLFSFPYIHWYQEYNFPFDFVHNIGSNYVWLYIYISLLGFYYIFRESKNVFFKRHFILLFILTTNYLLSRIFLSFDTQIYYEQEDYLNRIIYLAALTSLPIFLTPVYFWFKNEIQNGPNFWSRFFIVISTTIVISISTYFSYPVYDSHGNSKTFSVSDTDIKTVQFIEKHAEGENYIVLANQMLGATAIKEFGFAHYYNENFYYSMPLGNDNIYQNFINMIDNDASREEALAAMDKTNTNELFLIINNYWHSAKTAIAQAEKTADEKILVDNGVNTIFVYHR